MEISTELLIKIAQFSTPETRMNLFEAYPNIFNKDTRDYIRKDIVSKYYYRWKNNIGFWNIFWNRIPIELININTKIYDIFPEFKILQNKGLYELIDMPIYKLLISSLASRCYARKYLNNDISKNEYKQWIIGIIAKYSMRFPYQILTIKDLFNIIFNTASIILTNSSYRYNNGRFEAIFGWYTNNMTLHIDRIVTNLQNILINVPGEILLELIL